MVSPFLTFIRDHRPVFEGVGPTELLCQRFLSGTVAFWDTTYSGRLEAA